MKFRLLIISLVVSLFSPSIVFACSCLARPISDLLHDANAVFVGQVEEVIETRNNLNSGIENTKAKIKIIEKIKGDVGTEVTISGGGDPAMCGFGFRKGATYVVFASSSNNQLTTGSCSGNFVLSSDVATSEGRSAQQVYTELKQAAIDQGFISAPVVADNNNLVPVAIIALVALAGIVILVSILNKRKL